MNGLRCMASTVQILTFLSITFIVYVFVYLTLPNGTTIIHVTLSGLAPVLRALPANDTMISISLGKTDDNDDYNDTSKGK